MHLSMFLIPVSYTHLDVYKRQGQDGLEITGEYAVYHGAGISAVHLPGTGAGSILE